MSKTYIKPILKRKVAIGTTLIGAQYDMEQIEKTILILTLAGINQKQVPEPNTWYQVKLKDYATILGTREGDKITPMRADNAKVSINKAIKDLYERSVKFYNNEGLLEEHRWIVAYKELNSIGEINLKLNPELLEHVTDLKSFASFLTGSLAGVKGKYVTRILELVSQTPGPIGFIDLNIEDFVTMLEASKMYLEYKYLNRDILKPTFKELLDKEIIEIQSYPIKNGRKVTGFTLRYSKLSNYDYIPEIT